LAIGKYSMNKISGVRTKIIPYSADVGPFSLIDIAVNLTLSYSIERFDISEKFDQNETC